MSFKNPLLILLLVSQAQSFRLSSTLCSSPSVPPYLSLFLSRSHFFFSQMAPKRSKEFTTEASLARPQSKLRVSQLASTAAAPELFPSEDSFWRYSELFHGRDLVVGRRFNLSTLTATGLHFEEKLIKCDFEA